MTEKTSRGDGAIEGRHSLSDEVDSILVLHPTLQQSQSHQHGSPEDKQQVNETVRPRRAQQIEHIWSSASELRGQY